MTLSNEAMLLFIVWCLSKDYSFRPIDGALLKRPEGMFRHIQEQPMFAIKWQIMAMTKSNLWFDSKNLVGAGPARNARMLLFIVRCHNAGLVPE